MRPGNKIAVVGLWHLGEVYSACLAKLGHEVIGLDEDSKIIEGLKDSVPPLTEPGLPELLTSGQKDGKLSYSSDLSKVKDCGIVWFAFDTPVNDEDVADLSPIYEAVKKVVPYIGDGATIAVSSQLPVGTSAKIQKMICTARPGLRFGYFYNPENLRLGDAVRCFMEPDRVVIGADAPESVRAAQKVFARLGTEVVAMSVASAEMAKHAMNAWLATSIGFANDLADACEKAGADVESVIRALKSEPRVGQKAFLFAGLGFSGGTLGRDIQALRAFAKRGRLNLPVIEAAYAKNRSRGKIVVKRLVAEFGNLKGKKFTIFGVTYKPGTPTLRRSQPLAIEAMLRAAGAKLRLFDRLAIPAEVATKTPSALFRDPYEAARGSDAVLVLAPDRGLQKLDFSQLRSVMRSPVLFDAQNVLVEKEPEILLAGLRYLSIGRP